MLYRFRVLRLERPLVLVRLTGPFDLERSVQTLAALEFEPNKKSWGGLVWDVRRRSGYPDAAEVRELVDYWERWERVGIVTARDVQYGMARMASLLLDRAMAFRSLREAVTWASRGDAPR